MTSWLFWLAFGGLFLLLERASSAGLSALLSGTEDRGDVLEAGEAEADVPASPGADAERLFDPAA